MESSIKNNPAHVGCIFTADRLTEVDRLMKQYPEGKHKSARFPREGGRGSARCTRHAICPTARGWQHWRGRHFDD